MIVLEQLSIAARALRAHKFRSTLTVLSITIGSFAIVLMSSLAESGLDTLKKGIEDLGGARLLLVAPKKPERAEGKESVYAAGLTRADRDRVFSGLPHVELYSMYAELGTRDVVADLGASARTDVIAADSRFLEAYRMRLRRGRSFTMEDAHAHARVCVVGPKVADALWPGADPVGHRLEVAGLRCQVVGLLADNDRFGINFGFEWNDLVVLPAETAADAEPGVAHEAMILAKTDDAANNDVVKRIVNAVLTERHRGVDDFTLVDFSRIMVKFRTILAIMELIVGCIAGLALIIGGVGVMNMMLVSVSERVREIGIRKALGAGPADIRGQFLTEAVVLSTVGGALGVSAGAAAAVAASLLIRRSLAGWVGGVSLAAVVAALAVSAGIGVLFGYFPARRAGALDPIEAMRR